MKRVICILICIIVLAVSGACSIKETLLSGITESPTALPADRTESITPVPALEVGRSELALLGSDLVDATLSEILDSIQHNTNNINSYTRNAADNLIASAGKNYESYKANKQEVLDFYHLMIVNYSEFYDLTEQLIIAYYKQIPIECDLSIYSEWDRAMDDSYKTWDRCIEDTYDCWDRVFDDLYDAFDPAISEAYETDYKAASTDWTEMYQTHSDAWSALYQAKSSSWSLMYAEKSEVWSAFYSGDFDVESAINRAKEKKGEVRSSQPEETDAPEMYGPTDSSEPMAEPTETPEATSSSTGIRTEFQTAMDEYIELIKAYCAFMTEYNASPSLDKIVEYTEVLNQYQEAMNALDEIDTSELSTEELRLYLDTMNTVNQMLLSIH